MLVSTGRHFLPCVRSGKSNAPHGHQLDMKQHRTLGIGECLGHGPPADVTSWRLCRLLEAGFDRRLAEHLASSPRVDLHALLQLVDRGCPPALAARILSPIDETGTPA